MKLAALLFAAAAIAISSATASATSGFSFGRYGGNIIPLSVRISPTGGVVVNKEQRGVLTRTQLTALRRLVQKQGISTLPKRIVCPGVLPDVATRYVTADVNGKARRVTVQGGCNRRFDRIYDALVHAAGVTGA